VKSLSCGEILSNLCCRHLSLSFLSPLPHGLPLSPPALRPPFPTAHPPARALSLCTHVSTLADMRNTLAWRAGMALAPGVRCWRQLGARQCTTTDDQRRLRSRRAPGLGPVTDLRKHGASGCTKVSRVVFLSVLLTYEFTCTNGHARNVALEAAPFPTFSSSKKYLISLSHPFYLAASIFDAHVLLHKASRFMSFVHCRVGNERLMRLERDKRAEWNKLPSSKKFHKHRPAIDRLKHA